MPNRRRFKEIDRPTRTHPNVKLTAQEVTTIRYRYATTLLSQRKLSRQFGAAQSTISRIVNGEAWKHLPRFVSSVSESEKRKSNCVRGQSVPLAKLSDDAVQQIRRIYRWGELSQYRLAKDYHVCQKTIYNVVHQRTWSHVV